MLCAPVFVQNCLIVGFVSSNWIERFLSVCVFKLEQVEAEEGEAVRKRGNSAAAFFTLQCFYIQHPVKRLKIRIHLTQKS